MKKSCPEAFSVIWELESSVITQTYNVVTSITIPDISSEKDTT